MSLSGELVDLIAQKPVSAPDLEAAALFVLDTLASAVGGTFTDQGRILLRWAGQADSGDPAGRDCGRRALLIGALSHILEMDDLHRASVVHPGCAVVPAAWALAARHGSGGVALLKAVLWGYEAATRVGMAVGPEHYRIFHNTATCGPFGSAVAAGALLGLDRSQMIDALGNAGTQAAGLWQFLASGAMSNHLHAGRAAEAGVVAGELAALGFTGAPEVLEGEKGFFAGLAPGGEPARVLADPDAPWQLRQTSIKPWPSCRHTHPAIDAALELAGELAAKGCGPEQISAIRIGCYQAARKLCDREEPQSVYEAKFSLQHSVAAALGGLAPDFDAFEAEARAAFSGLRARCRIEIEEELEAAYPAHWGARIEVTLKDGSRIRARRRDARGDPELPLARGEMIEKARTLCALAPGIDAGRFIDGVLNLPHGGALPTLNLGSGN